MAPRLCLFENCLDGSGGVLGIEEAPERMLYKTEKPISKLIPLQNICNVVLYETTELK
jgi:hypothetical protein